MRWRCLWPVLLATACGSGRVLSPPLPDAAPDAAPADAGPIDAFCTHRLEDPPRTIVERPCGTFRASLTDGARTALLDAPERMFSEPTAANAVRVRVRVRVLPAPFSGTLDESLSRWLDGALRDDSAD